MGRHVCLGSVVLNGLCLAAAIGAGPAVAQDAAAPAGPVGQSDLHGPNSGSPGQAGTGGASNGDPQATRDGALADIVVTALKTSTNLQKTPLTVQTVSGNLLTGQSTTAIRDALKDVPGLLFSNQGSFGIQVQARGIGPGVLNGQGGVSQLYDGIYSSRLNLNVGFYDVSRIEVLLGPQGTLYGRNAEGGVLNIITNNPTHKLEGQTVAGVGNYGLYNFQGMANLPLADSLTLRVAGTYSRRQGYLSNGQDDDGTSGLRAKLLFDPSSAFSILLGGEAYFIDSKGNASVANYVDPPPSIRDVAYPSHQFFRRNAQRGWAEIHGDLGFADLTVIPSYIHIKEPEQLTYAAVPGSQPSGMVGFGRGAANESSIEARLSSHPSSPIQWIAGAYFYHLNDTSPGDLFQSGGDITESNGTIVLSPTAKADYTINRQTSQGYFAQATVPLRAGLRAIGGIRYSKDRSSYFSDGAASFPGDSHGSWSHVDYRAGLQYDVAPGSMLYASVASGYRPGGFSPAPPYAAYGIETVRSIEVGSKNQFLDGRLRVNGDVYYYDYRGYQQVTVTACVYPGAPNPKGLPPCPPGPPIIIDVVNVGKVLVVGGELAAQFAATPADRLSLNVAYNGSKIKSSLVLANSAPDDLVDVNGDHLPGAPVWAGNLSYEHDFDLLGGKLTPQAQADYQSRVNITLPVENPLYDQKSVVRFDASIAFSPESERWRLNLWARNLTDRVVKASVSSSTALYAPRTFGLTVTANFKP